MFPSPPLPWFELARFRRSRLTRAAIIAIMLVPLFYGALYVWANFNPTGNLDHIPAAIVNQDKLIQITDHDGKKQPVAVGRQLSANLIGSDSKSNYNWVLTDANDARNGLANGDYRAVLTIPENLSAAATSTGGDDPMKAIQGNLRLETNDAINYINGNIAKVILTAAKSTLNAQVTEAYLDNIYLSFSDLKLALNDAADGAGKLADGADQLTDGTQQLAAGATQLDAGAFALSSGLGTLSDKTKTLPRDTQRLADGAKQVASGTAEVNSLVQSVTGVITNVTDRANANATTIRTQLQSAKDQCVPADTPELCTLLTNTLANFDTLKTDLNVPAKTAKEFAGQTQKLSNGAVQVAAGNARLAASTPALVSGINQAAGGARQLANGTKALSDGAAKAAKGSSALAAGAHKLESGLFDGGKKVPDYDSAERSHLAKTASTPLTGDATHAHAVANYGEALAPYFIALALWVGAMSIYLLLRPVSKRAIASTASSTRIALAGLLPGLLIAAVQVLLLISVLEFLVGIEPASRLQLLGVSLMAGFAFVAINQMLIAVFGGAGRFVAIVLICLQLTAAGGTYPIETAPSLFGFLHNLMPLTYAVDGIRKTTAGSTVGLTADMLALALFAVLALAITVISTQRSRVVTMKRLHPTLAI